jgi:hypothetical protein
MNPAVTGPTERGEYVTIFLQGDERLLLVQALARERLLQRESRRPIPGREEELTRLMARLAALPSIR